jgi:hypothetical protein
VAAHPTVEDRIPVTVLVTFNDGRPSAWHDGRAVAWTTDTVCVTVTVGGLRYVDWFPAAAVRRRTAMH